MDRYEKDYAKLKDLLKKQGGKYDYDLIKRAYDKMVRSHHGQRRSSGEEYYHHPLSVAEILVGLGMDSESIAAALLHDVVEDTDVTEKELEDEFGEAIAVMVDGVTKLGKLPLSTTEQLQAENLRKMLIAMAKDIRVIIIKLADRLHNMRTIDAMSEQHQRDKALETLDIYAPIAHRLGIRAVKEELEDLAIKHLDPVGYAEIEQLLAKRSSERESVLQGICDRIKSHLKELMPGVKTDISGRVKSIHGIYRKMFVAGKDFDEIYDVFAIRIITDTVADCYNILGIMHDMYQPLPGRFKDYISTPKANMYQSLHTTLIGAEKIPFEVQIRTFDMHHTAEYGIAAHWKYKEGILKSDQNLEERLAWIRQILEAQKDSDNPEEILQSIKTDLSSDDVFAVTPKGDVISLPSGSTVIDFAFAIHSAVGTKMVGAKANGRIVPLNHAIQTGEIIEILTTNQAGHGPSRDWLNFARTTSAKQKIRTWFKKERRPENIETGRNQIERDFARNNIRLPEDEMAEFIEKTAARQHFNSVDDFYAAIGYGGVVLSKIMPRIKDEYQHLLKDRNETIRFTTPVNVTHSSNGITVEGIDNCLVKLSKCCTPLPGDEIIGYITRGHGVSIHKRDCNNVPRDIALSPEPERWVNAYFENTGNSSFKASLMITGNDRITFLSDVLGAIAQMSVPVHNVNARQLVGGNAVINVTVSVLNVKQITAITQKIQKIEGVFSVERIKG